MAILQSAYIPWHGYFDLIDGVDTFVFLECVQFTKQDWRNRNYLKGHNCRVPMIVPVTRAGGMARRLRDAEIADWRFGRKHLRTLAQYYARAPYFDQVYEAVRPVLETGSIARLSDLNIQLICLICELVGIETRLIRDDELGDFSSLDRMDRLMRICRQLDATTYVSGHAAKSYIDEGVFEGEGVALEYFDYPKVIYPQVQEPFEEHVSVLDLLCCVGSQQFRSVRVS